MSKKDLFLANKVQNALNKLLRTHAHKVEVKQIMAFDNVTFKFEGVCSVCRYNICCYFARMRGVCGISFETTLTGKCVMNSSNFDPLTHTGIIPRIVCEDSKLAVLV
jgi:hypothetical protein